MEKESGTSGKEEATRKRRKGIGKYNRLYLPWVSKWCVGGHSKKYKTVFYGTQRIAWNAYITQDVSKKCSERLLLYLTLAGKT